MSDDFTDANSLSQPRKKVNQEELKPNQIASKMKKKRKSTMPKIHAENKQENEMSNQKQVKLTQLWRIPHNGLSQSLSKNIVSNDGLKKKMQQQIQLKNKRIVELKKERDQMQRKYNVLQNEKKFSQAKTKQNLKKVLLQLAKVKRNQKGEINPKYGYFKDINCTNFVEGPFLKQLKATIQTKTQQIKQLKQQQINKNNKQMIQFRERFVQKQLDQLNQQLKQRQKVVLAYRQRLKFAQKQANCYYSKLGWPAVGEAERFQTLELLGSGGFGQVYKCYDLLQNCYVALKENRFTSSGPKVEQIKQQFLKHVNRQVKIQKNLNHPNIAKFIQLIKIDQSQVSFVLQHCEGPQLSKYLKKYQCLEQKQAKQIIRQILCALKYLYEQDNKIIHYDLKPSNIMFNRGTIKILDFGLCKQMESDQTRINLTSQGVGTYWYLPPETFLENDPEVSSKVDIWSVGVIFYQLLYGRRPFGHGVSQTKIIHQGIILKQAIKVQFPQQTPLKYKVSEGAKAFISQCLKYKQEDRLSPLQAYEHEYFN